MSIKSKLKAMRDNYVIRQVERADIPEFGEDEKKRYRILFSGRVQKVGFRFEVEKLAERLGLTGFCENLENGDVLAELQGPENRILYLVSFMSSLKRIKIRSKKMKTVPVKEETGFERK